MKQKNWTTSCTQNESERARETLIWLESVTEKETRNVHPGACVDVLPRCCAAQVCCSLCCSISQKPRPQGLLAFQFGGGRREDPGTQRTKTIADWCILLRVHTCALIGLFIPKQRWLSFEGFVEAEKCFLQCLRRKWWTEFRSDCSENRDCTVGRQRFENSDIWNGNRWEYYKA